MRNFCFLFFLICNSFANGQTVNYKFDNIILKNALESEWFQRRDTFREEPSDETFGYFNQPIRANIRIEEDWGKEELIFCHCNKSGDTINIELTLPGVCCFYTLFIKFIGDQFTSYVHYEDDINFKGTDFFPREQTVMLQKGDDQWRGYIDFQSLKVEADPDSIYPVDPSSKSPEFRQLNAKGFFTCDPRRMATLDAYSVKKQLQLIHERDQKTRRGTDSVPYIDFIDSTNRIFIEKLISKYGWLNKSFVGDEGNRTCFLVIQHADLATQEKYLPLMQASVELGESATYDLALLQDRVLMRQGKKQIYGSQVVRDESNGQWKFYPIENESYVNVRRAAVGLRPIEEDAAYFGIDYKVDLVPAKF